MILHSMCSDGDTDKNQNGLNGMNPPTKTLDANVKNVASQTGEQTSFIVLLLQAKNSFFSIQILV